MTEATKSVIFIPLSPKSSQTLKRHHEESGAKPDDQKIDPVGPARDPADNNQLVPHSAFPHYSEEKASSSSAAPPESPRHRRRSGSDASDRALSSKRRHPPNPSASDEDEEVVIESLPDRFDSHGRPLDQPSRLASRRGEFEYRSKRPDGWQMKGQWGVAGSDGEAVERTARQIQGLLEGKGGWLGVLGGLLGATLGSTDKRLHDDGRDAPGPSDGGSGERRRHRGERDRDRDRHRDQGDKRGDGHGDKTWTQPVGDDDDDEEVVYGGGDYREVDSEGGYGHGHGHSQDHSKLKREKRRRERERD